MHPQPIEEALLLKFNSFGKKNRNKNTKHFGNYHNYDKPNHWANNNPKLKKLPENTNKIF
jgi:hypothetical protein